MNPRKLLRSVVALFRDDRSHQSADDKALWECTASLTLSGFSSGNTLRGRKVVFGTDKITYSPPTKGYWPLRELWYDEILELWAEGTRAWRRETTRRQRATFSG